MQKELLVVAGAIECFAGLAFLLVPKIVISLLLGIEPGSVAMLVGRVAGAALLSLGISCWGASRDAGGAARTATLRAITLYNAVVACLLIAFALTGQARGVIVWIAALVHVVVAAALVASLRVTVPAKTASH
jgi:hypothetical protein